MTVQGVCNSFLLPSCSSFWVQKAKTASTHHIRQSHFIFPSQRSLSPFPPWVHFHMPLQIDFCTTLAAAAEAAAASHYFLICFSRFAFAWFFALFVFFFFVVICLLLCLAFLEQSPFTRLCVLLLALSRSRLSRKPLFALSCLIVCVCVRAASLFRQCSTLAFTSWDLCIFSNWRGQHRFVFLLFSLCSRFLIFSLRFSFAISINFLAALFALITSAWQSFARRWLSSLILISMPGDNRVNSFKTLNSGNCRNFCVSLSVALCVCVVDSFLLLLLPSSPASVCRL